MKKWLFWLVAMLLIAIGSLTYAENELIVRDTTGWTITIYTWDFSYGITIQDKNLWASVVWTWPTSYWYYFQWWNNHWNPEWSEEVTQLINWDDSYENHWYDGEVTKFINIFGGYNWYSYWDSLSENYDYWVETSIGDGDIIYANWTWNNLWWWWNDKDNNNPNVIEWYDTVKHEATNVTWRQWPCPEWYHVPSAWEWEELILLWCKAKSDTCDGDTVKRQTNYHWQNGEEYYFLKKDYIWTTFSNDLELPLAGIRQDIYRWQASFGDYSSSSISNDFLKDVLSFHINSGIVSPGGIGFRADGMPVRCFKNEYIEFPKFTVTFIDDGVEVASWSVVSGEVRSGTIPTPDEKDGYKFLYRYVQWAEDTGFDFSGTTITWNISLYAKWTIAEYEITYNLNDWAETRANPTIYTALSWTFWLYQPTKTGYMFLWWTWSNGNSVNANIYITKWSTWNRTYNAVWWDFEDIDAYFISDTWTVSYITLMDRNMWASSDDITSTGSYGFHYQWWNNYGFGVWCWENWCSDEVTTKAITEKTVWNDSYDNSNYWWSIFVKWDWSHWCDYWSDSIAGSGNHKNLWWGWNDWTGNRWWLDTILLENVENRQWPCLVGYHVPSIWEWNELVKHRADTYIQDWNELILNESASKLNYFSNNVATDKFQENFKISAWGYRYYNGVYRDDKVSYLRASSLNGMSNLVGARSIVTTPSNSVQVHMNVYRAFAYPVRCFSNDYMFTSPSMSIHPNGWTGAMILVEWDTIKSLWIPNRDAHSIFEGWYSTFEFTTWSEVNTWSTAPANLYARWSCTSWYVENNSGTWCIELYTITYELNDWVLSWNNATWYTIESETITLINPTKTWYTFTWRSGTELNSLTTSVTIPTWSTWDREYEANWEINQYTITFKDWDNEITSITADYWTWITSPSNPTKNGYKFTGWDPEVPATMPAENMTINAKWERNWSSGGWWGGWGWWGSSSKTGTGSTSSQTWNQINSNTWDIASTWTNIKEPESNTGSNIQTWIQVDSSEQTTQNDSNKSMDSSTSSQDDGKTYSTEFQEAYEFAKWNWITTMSTIQKANMEWKLTRIAMAKMLSQYAINVLWKTPDTTQSNKFNDVTDKQNSDYDDGVTLAYQLWIMWQNMPWNNFRPNDEVTRAEFATALSRMAYWTSDWEYKATSKYYVHHMEKLVKEWIITNDDPNMKELRWYVMIMLMRSAK